jgi:predicted ATPase/DNA-binding SARP family transcriptional activator/class 3 adenylate cyclase/Tfp pilus assembly protein PilF
LAVRILGPLEIDLDGREIVVSGLRRRALMVRLVVSANEVIPTGRLIEDVWDGAPPPGAASTLQSHVSVLRGLIGSERIRYVDGGYLLTLEPGERDSDSVDEITEARRAERAGDVELAAVLLEEWLGRWRGGALADVAGAAWAIGEVTHLEEMRVGALEQWLGVRLALGDHGSVVADAERAVNEYPLREGFWAALMLAQYRSGRQSDALRSFGRLRSVLGEELGIEPSAELRDLEEAVLLQKRELDWQPPPGVPKAADALGYPSGEVTFLFTGIEGATALLEQVGDDVFGQMLEDHHRIVRKVIAAHHGFEVSADEAGFFVVFSDAGQALAMAAEAQVALDGLGDAVGFPVRVRMGLHTGPGRRVGDTYVGLAVHQASLVGQAGHGGQIVATQATVAAGALTEAMSWQPLGRHRLQSLSEPLELHQLCHPKLEENFAALQSSGALTHHLPAQVSSFLGRVEELTLGAKLLAASRLVSVVGPGGAGKTRVAYQLAETQLAQFPGGVWVAELAPEVDPQRIPALLLSGLGLRDEPGRTATETIVSYLADRRALVLLDNCEHLIDAAATFTTELLRTCPQVRVLATSREALRIPGESVWQLGPLQLPEASEVDLGVIAGADAVALFCERAAAASAGFDLDLTNAATVMTICHRLEGMALAIELAAAWVRTLPLAEIAERLEHSLDLLSKGSRQGAHRHSSLRAALTWSHDLLAPTEQVLFRRLAVFAGGFTLAAAERVTSGEGLDIREVLDALDGLVDKSLVGVSIDQAGQGRYTLLETVRAYAQERLVDANELSVHADRAASFYSQLGSTCAVEGPTGAAFDRLEADHLNILATLSHYAERDQPTEHGRLVVDLAEFWYMRDYWRLGEGELLRYLNRGDRDEATSAACLRRIAIGATRVGEYVKAQDCSHQALAIARQCGDRQLEALCLAGLGNVGWYLADYAESAVNYEAALVIARQLGDRHQECKWVCNLGMVTQGLAKYSEASSYYERAVALARQVGDHHTEAAALGSLGIVASELGDDAGAMAYYEETLAMFREIGDRHNEAGYIGNMGRATMRLGEYHEAQSHFEEALAMARELGDRQSEGYWIGCLGEVAAKLGEYPEAQLRCQEALGIAREVGDRRSQRDWLVELGGIACALGGHVEAGARYQEALEIAREVEKPDGQLLEACAELLVSLERHEDGAELLGAADAISDHTQGRRSAWEQSRYAATLDACRAHQSEPAFEAAYARGRGADWACANAHASELLGRG